jgi:hypothetical protein
MYLLSYGFSFAVSTRNIPRLQFFNVLRNTALTVRSNLIYEKLFDNQRDNFDQFGVRVIVTSNIVSSKFADCLEQRQNCLRRRRP